MSCSLLDVGTSVSHVLLFLTRVQRVAVDVAGRGEVDDRHGGSGLVVAAARREQRRTTKVGDVPVHNRLRRLRVRLHCDLLEQYDRVPL